jgi:integrase
MPARQRLASTKGSEVESFLPPPFVHARFDDKVWKLFVKSQGSTHNVDWASLRFSDNTLLTDPINDRLMQAAKLFLLASCQGTETVREHKGGAVLGAYHAFVPLLRWTVSRGLRSLENLTMEHAVSYRNHVRRRELMPDGTFTNDTLSSSRQSKLLTVLKQLCKLQENMGDCGTNFTANEIADLDDKLRIKVTYESTKLIPDEQFHQILERALIWLNIEAPKVLLVIAAFASYRKNREGRVNNQRSRARYEREAVAVLKGTTINFGGINRDLLSLSKREVERLTTITRAACFVIIASLTGMRVSEICSLKLGCLRLRRLDDSLKVLELHGILYKTVRPSDGVPAQWVAGYDESDNPCRLAVTVLEALPRPDWSSNLFVAMKQVEQKRERLANSNIMRDLEIFMEAIGMAEFDIGPHQFRRTFARFVALSTQGSPFVLMRHFKHASVLMTERYLVSDPELLSEIYEAVHSVIFENLDSIFGAERLGGLAGQRILATNEPYRGAVNAAPRKRLIEMTVRDPSSHFRPVPQGMCMYEEMTAKCGGDVANVGLSTCIGCYNFAVHARHLPSWFEARDAVQATIDEQKGLGFISIELYRQLNELEQVIARIQGSCDGSSSSA